jgi:lauroyl/myristoyl acyltransferase
MGKLLGSAEARTVHPGASDKAWATYCAARLLALGAPLDDLEQAAMARAEVSLQRCFGFDSAAAAYHARRCLLFRREHLIHESFVLDMPVSQVLQIIDSVVVVGLEQLLHVNKSRGLLLVSLHYSLYSSLLWLWLARAAARGLIRRFTVFMRSGYMAYGAVSEHRWEHAERSGLLSRESFALVDRTESGPSAAARELVSRLRRGDVVLLFPDASFIPQKDRAIELSIGRQTISLPRGAAWLVQAVQCPVLPVYLRPDAADGHAVVFGAVHDTRAGFDPGSVVQGALQHLVHDTVMADPGPWEGWFRDWLPQ